MGPKRRAAVVVVALTVTLGIVPSTSSQAFPSNGGTETAQLDMPGNGTGVASTSALPAAATQADVTVTPLTDQQFFGKLAVVLGSPQFDFSERVEGCVYLTESVIKDPNTFPGYTIPKDRTLQTLFLAACLQTALEVSLSSHRRRMPPRPDAT